MKKTIFCILASIFMFIPLKTFATDFTDSHGISSTEAIKFLQTNNIVKGYEGNIYKPDKNITRAEFLKIVLEANNVNLNENCKLGASLYDVSQSDWFFDYVCYAVSNDIINGYPNNTFKPNDPINYVEAAKIVANVEGLETSEDANEEWFAGFLDALKRERVIPGSINSNSDNITRGQMAEIIWGLKTGYEVENKKIGEVPKIASCEELTAQFEKFNKRNNASYGMRYKNGGIMPEDMVEVDFEMEESAVAAPMKALAATREENKAVMSKEKSESAADYSTTNVQEFGVDEADIIKNDGSHIFIIKGHTIRIIKAYPAGDMKQDAVLAIDDDSFTPQEMYLDEDTLTVIGTSYGYIHPEPLRDDIAETKMMPPHYYGGTVKTFIFDVSNRQKPKQMRAVFFEGNYNSSRKIGDVVYLVVNKYNYYNPPIRITDVDMPSFSDSARNEEKYIARCTDVEYIPNFKDSNYLIIAAIDTKEIAKKVNRKIILGSGNQIYASTDNLYATRSVWEEYFWEGKTSSTWKYGNFTEIFKFALNETNISFQGKGKVAGNVLNQFSMSEYNDHFRIATHENNENSNNVFILDKNMKQKSKIFNIAPDEQIKSARFIGEKGYLVTFKSVDPLFVIDLNPDNPKILGKLKIPGWSDYLHPYDEDHLIGFGREVNPEAEKKGRLTTNDLMGMKLSIFDVSDINNPIESHKLIIGARGTTSEILNNHKALLFDKDKGIMAFPITVTEKKEGDSLDCKKYSDEDCPSGCNRICEEGDKCFCVNPAWNYNDVRTVFSGAYIYDIDLDTGFKLRGAVTHYEDNDVFKNSGAYFYGDQDFNIQRIIYIGKNFYSISQNVVKALNWDDISEENKVVLDEKDCHEIYEEAECKAYSHCTAVYDDGPCTTDSSGNTVCNEDNEFAGCEEK